MPALGTNLTANRHQATLGPSGPQPRSEDIVRGSATSHRHIGFDRPGDHSVGDIEAQKVLLQMAA